MLGGGPTSKADLQDARLLRGGQKILINLSPESVLALSRVKVRRGDVLHVPRALRIGVVGEVRVRGMYAVSRRSKDPLGKLLEWAEATPTAALHRLEILRPSLPGPLIVDARDRARIRLEDGDILLVPMLGYSVLGSVDKPGKFPLSGGETLGAVVSAAGSSHGRLNEVVVIRAADVASGGQKGEVYDLRDESKAGVKIYDGDVVFVPGEASDRVFKGLRNIDFTKQPPGWLDLYHYWRMRPYWSP